MLAAVAAQTRIFVEGFVIGSNAFPQGFLDGSDPQQAWHGLCTWKPVGHAGYRTH